jgi:hypothetical protein
MLHMQVTAYESSGTAWPLTTKDEALAVGRLTADEGRFVPKVAV